MKTSRLLLVSLLLAITATAKPPADLQARLDAWIKDQPGGIAAAWVDQEGTTFFQAGSMDPADPRAITADTVFEIGSVTKVFTSLLLAESERVGKVNRHDSAAKYLLPAQDPAQAALAKITLLSLATHSSGLPRLPANLGPNPDANPDPYANYDRTQLIEALRIHGPTANVGGTASYSNFGVSVLGEALGAAWGTTYTAALQEHVLIPLGLKATTMGLAGSAAPADLAPGHFQGRRVPNWTFQACAPAGGIRSSTRELALLLSACLGYRDTPLRAALTETFRPQRPFPDLGAQIGLAWILGNDAAAPIVWHNGATLGSHAFIGFNPKLGAGVVLLANVQKGSEALGQELLGAKPTPAASVPPIANAADYAGIYPLAPTFAIRVRATADALFVQASGQPEFGLRAVSTDRFGINGVPAEVSFERGSDGKVIALVLHQNGRDQRAPRKALPTEVELPVTTLREYVGDYPLSPQFILTVTEEAGVLAVQATNQGKLPVFPSAKDEFFYQVVDAQISFTRDSAGVVKGLVLHQGGRDTPAQKTR